MKKLIGIIGITIILFSTVLNPSYAKETETSLLEYGKYKTIKVYDSNTEAKLSVLEKKEINNKFNIESVMVNNQTNEKIVEFSSSNDIVKTRELQNINTGAVVTEYALSAFATYELSGSATDGAIAVRANSKLFFTLHGDHSDYVHLEKVEYSWQKLDSQVSVTDKKIRLIQMGPGLYGGGQTQSKIYDASADGTIHTSSLNWDPVLKNGLLYNFGTKMTATISQGLTRSWSLDWNLTY